mmetsp:Transcript_885/g.2023  ORF Transcript_885/g.2023 Transcript_885/m.2023 type:complete len:402 (-) Transcript_885:518-1723(-)
MPESVQQNSRLELGHELTQSDLQSKGFEVVVLGHPRAKWLQHHSLFPADHASLSPLHVNKPGTFTAGAGVVVVGQAKPKFSQHHKRFASENGSEAATAWKAAARLTAACAEPTTWSKALLCGAAELVSSDTSLVKVSKSPVSAAVKWLLSSSPLPAARAPKSSRKTLLGKCPFCSSAVNSFSEMGSSPPFAAIAQATSAIAVPTMLRSALGTTKTERPTFVSADTKSSWLSSPSLSTSVARSALLMRLDSCFRLVKRFNSVWVKSPSPSASAINHPAFTRTELVTSQKLPAASPANTLALTSFAAKSLTPKEPSAPAAPGRRKSCSAGPESWEVRSGDSSSRVLTTPSPSLSAATHAACRMLAATSAAGPVGVRPEPTAAAASAREASLSPGALVEAAVQW